MRVSALSFRSALAATIAALAVACLGPACAQAAFSITKFDGTVTGQLEAPYTQAGGHPFQVTTEIEFATTTDNLGHLVPDGSVKQARVTLPPGFIGNPLATERCTEAELATDTCPTATQVGVTSVTATDGSFSGIYPIYNMVPVPGKAAEFGFNLENVIWVHLFASVEPDGAVTVSGEEISQLAPLAGVKTTFWGIPADPAHNSLRICHPGAGFGCPPVGPEVPFLSLPTSCDGPGEWSLKANAWQQPEPFATASFLTHAPGEPENLLGNEGCNALQFSPTLKARPTTEAGDSPSGLEVDLHLPQDEDPESTATAELREAVVTLPPGMSVNPSSANGLGACTPVQIGLGTTAQPSCPDASKIGTIEVDTPALDHPAKGGVYLAQPNENPFSCLIAIYIVIDDPASGVVVKIPAQVSADPLTGQLSTTVKDSPQLPFEDFKLAFKTGAGAPLRTPALCGSYSTTSSLLPWSAPESGPAAELSDTYPITASCSPSAASEPHAPFFDAGALTPLAGAYSPFVVDLRREDGSQEIASLDLTLPPGLSGKLAGIPYCPEAALAAAADRSGAAEQASPSCPAASRVGKVTVGVGAGPTPYYTGGQVYLAGPYKGAPLSLATITPALAGPFDLGTIVVRAALQVDPETAQVRVVSDPLPRILQGIPVDLRSLRVRMDRPEFTLNPTSCDPTTISGQVASTQGQDAPVSQRFQLGECGALGFKPRLSMRLRGGTRRTDHPALETTLRPRAGNANIARAVVTLPHAEFIDQAHINNPCTRVQFAAHACPPGSVLGTAKAYSPLFEKPLEGPVYFRSNGGERELPDIVLDLKGQVHVTAVGFVDSRHGRIRTTFATVPDDPISKLQLKLKGGKHGLLVNSANLCARKRKAHLSLTAHNGKAYDFGTELRVKCPHGKRGHRQHG